SPHVDSIEVGSGVIVGVIDCSVAAVPESNAFVVIVNVCACLISFTALCAIVMLASTNRFVFEPELPCEPSVVRRTVAVGGVAPASLSVNVQEESAVAV